MELNGGYVLSSVLGIAALYGMEALYCALYGMEAMY